MTPKEKQVLYSVLSVAVLIGALVVAQSKGGETRRVVASFEQSWPEFQKTLPVYPVAGAREWYLDGVQVVGPGVLLAQFEDGHTGHVAVVKYEGGDFDCEGVFKDRLTFDREYYLDILQYFGDMSYDRENYIRYKNNGLTEVRQNILVNQNN